MFLTDPRSRRRLVFLGAALLGTVAGCASDESVPKLVPVTGKLTVGGNPLPGAAVSFRPDAMKGNASGHLPTGKTNEQGEYALTTIGKKGAPVGHYKVVVVLPGKIVGAPGANPPLRETRRINAKYTDAKTTDLSAEVKEGLGPLSFDLLP